MANNQQQELFDYYDERAPEYEEFYHGNFASPIDKPDIYRDDTREIISRLPALLSGHCLDIACGTGFWLPHYHQNCAQITLIDQSGPALEETRTKIDKLGIGDKSTVIKDDVFNHDYPEHYYDRINIGFFISHFTDDELERLFRILRHTLAPGGSFIIIDSTWSDYIAGLGRKKAGMITRELFDGRTFEIYKRFFSTDDLRAIADRYRFRLKIEYLGNVFFLAAGTFE